MRRDVRDFQEIEYTLTPQEVKVAVIKFIDGRTPDNSPHTACVSTLSTVVVTPDGAASIVTRYAIEPKQ